MPGVPPAPRDLELVEVAGGTRLRLRIKAGARRSAILGVHGGALKLSVTAPAERGKANRAVIELLAEVLGLAPSAIELVSGSAARDKTVIVPLSAATILERLILPRRRLPAP